MLYTGIDLSLSNTGLIVINEKNEIILEKSIKTTPTKEKSNVATINRIRGITTDIIFELKNLKIKQVAIEGFSYGSKGNALFEIAYLGYRVREELYLNNINFIDPTPHQLKQFVTGKGNTKKSEVMLQVYKKWGAEFSDDNLADAYVLAQMLKGKVNDKGLTKLQQSVLDKVKGSYVIYMK